MGQRAEALEQQLKQVVDDVLATVESTADTQWKKTTPAENWPVCVAAHHISMHWSQIPEFAQLIVAGQPVPPMTMEMIDQGNAEHAKQFASCTKQQALADLKGGSEKALAFVRGLSDQDLDRSAPMAFAGGAPWSAQQMIETGLINHARGHLDSIRAAT